MTMPGIAPLREIMFKFKLLIILLLQSSEETHQIPDFSPRQDILHVRHT